MNFTNLINHQSNGAKGLRIAASILIVIGWIAFAYCFIRGCVSEYIDFFMSLLYGAGTLGAMYIQACVLRALASVAEVAQIYYNNNAFAQTDEDE